MMFLTAIVLLAGAVSPAGEANLESLQNRKFNISGFYCDDVVCEDNPRPLGDALRFDNSMNNTRLDHTQYLSESWNVILNCSISDGRLEHCRMAGEQNSASIAIPIALQLVQGVGLAPGGRNSSRAIVTVQYEAGDCPPWYCSITPAPPPPPASK